MESKIKCCGNSVGRKSSFSLGGLGPEHTVVQVSRSQEIKRSSGQVFDAQPNSFRGISV